ncbi:MAG: DUF4276 family protein [Rubrivivax sp.]|nr:DUF4276 family protein [Rubrivivax sp.]
MTSVIVPIVEGDGEVQALPVLLRRVALVSGIGQGVRIERPIRVHRDRFLNRQEELRRMVILAREKAGPDGAILVLLDADDDCPARLGPELQARVRGIVPQTPACVVLANREYEAWFMASAASLHGVRGFQWDGVAPPDPDLLRDAKGWIRLRTLGRRYGPVHDQAALSDHIEIDVALARSRSFRKLVSAWQELVGMHRHGE